MSKWLFGLLGVAAYPLLVYVILPYFVARMDMGSTDAAGAGMARAFSYIYGCIIWSVILFFAQMLVEWLLFHSVWRTLVCLAVGLFCVWALQAGAEYWQANRRSDFTAYYDTGEVERRGQHIGTAGEVHGQLTTYYKNGQIKSIENYNRDRVDGACKLFYEHGGLKAEGRMLDIDGQDAFEGIWRYYDESGALDDEREFDKGELVSSQNYTLYCDDQGLVRTISGKRPYTGKLDKAGIVRRGSLFPNLFSCELVDGQIEQGPVAEYYKFGTKIVLAGSYAYANAKLTGPKRTYHPNSQLKSQCTYCNGKIEGEYVSYYADSVASRPQGGVAFCGYYVADERDGVARWYNPDGRLDSEQPHRRGQRAGVTVRYFYVPDYHVDLVLQTLYVNDQTLSELTTSFAQREDRSRLEFHLKGSNPEFVAEFESWRKLDSSWLLMEREIKPDTLVSRLNAGAKCEGCYALLRGKVLPCGASLPEQLPEQEHPVSVALAGGGRIEIEKTSFRQWEIRVEQLGRIMSYDLAEASDGSWLTITTIKK